MERGDFKWWPFGREVEVEGSVYIEFDTNGRVKTLNNETDKIISISTAGVIEIANRDKPASENVKGLRV